MKLYICLRFKFNNSITSWKELYNLALDVLGEPSQVEYEDDEICYFNYGYEESSFDIIRDGETGNFYLDFILVNALQGVDVPLSIPLNSLMDIRHEVYNMFPVSVINDCKLKEFSYMTGSDIPADF